jgi:hypothetical protein
VHLPGTPAPPPHHREHWFNVLDPQKSVKLRAWDVMMVALVLFVAFTAPYQVRITEAAGAGAGRLPGHRALGLGLYSLWKCPAAGADETQHHKAPTAPGAGRGACCHAQLWIAAVDASAVWLQIVFYDLSLDSWFWVTMALNVIFAVGYWQSCCLACCTRYCL